MLEHALRAALRREPLEKPAIEAVRRFLEKAGGPGRNAESVLLDLLGEWLFEHRVMQELPDTPDDPIWRALVPCCLHVPEDVSPRSKLRARYRKCLARSMRQTAPSLFDRGILDFDVLGDGRKTGVVCRTWMEKMMRESKSDVERRRIRSAMRGSVPGRLGVRDVRFNPYAVVDESTRGVSA